MTLHRLLKSGSFLVPRLRWTSPRHARRTVTAVPVLACIPGSDVWFLRFALAFLAHLREGGCIADRLHGRIAGNPAGRPFNFHHMTGGPLLWAPSLVRSGHLFIGHATCPGFSKIAATVPWWRDTQFCAPGYDYFREGLNYAQVPVDMAPHAYARVSVSKLDAAAWVRPAQRAVLVYPDPLEQAGAYFNYGRNHVASAYNTLAGRRLTEWTFRDYLFQQALPSYAKIFISYQAMASAVPRSVSIVPHAQLLARPASTLASMLSHLADAPQDGPMIEDAVRLARREHLAAVERELGRPLDGTRRRRTRTLAIPEEILLEQRDPDLRREALAFLASLGVDPRYFAPAPDMAAKSRLKSVA